MDEGSSIATSCGAGRRCSSDPALPWLWCRLAAAAPIPIHPLAWEPPDGPTKTQKKKKSFTAEGAWRSPVLAGLKQEEATTNTQRVIPKKRHAGRLAPWHPKDRETNCWAGFSPSELPATLHGPGPSLRQTCISTQAQAKNKFLRKAIQSPHQDEHALWPGFLFGKIVC